MAAPTVLIVEDDNVIRMETADVFEDAGFSVSEAWTGGMALKFIEQHPSLNIVFTDVHMPGNPNGLALAFEIARRWPSIALMVCSGEIELTASQLPPNVRFFSKPYSFQDATAAACRLVA